MRTLLDRVLYLESEEIRQYAVRTHSVMPLVDPDRSEYRFKRIGGIVRAKGIFLGQRTGSGGATGWESQSVFSIAVISSQRRQLTYCSLLLGILACLNLCYGQERRCRSSGCRR